MTTFATLASTLVRFRTSTAGTFGTFGTLGGFTAASTLGTLGAFTTAALGIVVCRDITGTRGGGRL
jgi:hypothetical protein